MGLFLMLIGFLVKHSPHLIAGYNTMQQERKKNVDIKGLSTFIRNTLVITGLSIIAGFIMLYILKMYEIADFIAIPFILAGIAIILVRSPKYNHN